MCGFLGFVTRYDNYKYFEYRFKNGLNLINHRGPDSSGSEIIRLNDSVIGLGHKRLSIIDTSNSADQPFASSCGRYIMVYNGEIYNYIEIRDKLKAEGHFFRTESDTEVLLAAWKQWKLKCLRNFIGMFSFAVLDKYTGLLTCVRDAFGIKPLYYSNINNAIIFGSDIRSIICMHGSKSKPNLQSAYDYIVHGICEKNNETFVEGINHLKPGHWVEYDLKTNTCTSPSPWWQPDLNRTLNIGFLDACNRLRALFLDCLKYNLRSDVPIAATLSGGIDSSAIVCGMRELCPQIPIHTFSYIPDDIRLSEENWIDQINTYVNAVPHKIKFTADDIIRDIDDMILMQGEPFLTSSIYAQWCVFKVANQQGITVTLDGQGADEILAGYNGYPGYRLLSLIEEKKFLSAFKFSFMWGMWPGRSILLAWMYFFKIVFPDSLYLLLRNIFRRASLPAWIISDVLANKNISYNGFRSGLNPINKGKRVREALSSSLQSEGLPALLRYADRNSMSFSIESRVPFLSLPLVEFLLSLPEDYLISCYGKTKHVFREAMRGVVPDSHLDRRDKIGFQTPQVDLMRSMIPGTIDILSNFRGISFIDSKRLVSHLNSFLDNTSQYDPQLWRTLIYLRWYNLILDPNF